jgi:hypothetical protein
MYCLRAVIATEQVLSELAGAIEDAHGAHIVFLGQHLPLLPTTDALFDAATAAGASSPGGLSNVPAAFGRMLAACSANGPVAYVEAEFFGGTGEQHAQVWDNGAVVLGPLHLGENEPIPPTGTPISQALRRLGVTKGNHTTSSMLSGSADTATPRTGFCLPADQDVILKALDLVQRNFELRKVATGTCGRAFGEGHDPGPACRGRRSRLSRRDRPR